MRKVSAVLVFGFLGVVLTAVPASAVTSLQLIACQGTTCAATPVTVGSNISIVAPVVVGDFTVNAQGASNETTFFSNAQETSIQVQRTSLGSTAPLDVYLVATNYLLPATPTLLDSTHGATFADNPLSINGASAVTFIGWFNDANTGLLGVPAGGGAFNTGVALPAGLQTNGLITCTPGPGSPSVCSAPDPPLVGINGGAPFSLITRTTFNVPAAGQFDIYTSNSQVVVGFAAVPEPATMVLLGTGLLGVLRARKKLSRQ